MKNVVIYSTPTCTYCKMTKEFLTEHDVPFTDYNVADDTERRQEMVDKSQQKGVPVVDIEGNILVGFNKEKLTEFLEL